MAGAELSRVGLAGTLRNEPHAETLFHAREDGFGAIVFHAIRKDPS